MGLFGRGKDKREDDLRATGTPVPAQLVRRKESIWERRGGTGFGSGDEYKGQKVTMSWEAHTPEGKVVEFQDEALWGPEEGTWLEAVVDDAREQAALVMNLSDYNFITGDQEEIRRLLRVSNAKAEALRGGGAAPTDTDLAAIDGQPGPEMKSLKDALGG